MKIKNIWKIFFDFPGKFFQNWVVKGLKKIFLKPKILKNFIIYYLNIRDTHRHIFFSIVTIALEFYNIIILGRMRGRTLKTKHKDIGDKKKKNSAITFIPDITTKKLTLSVSKFSSKATKIFFFYHMAYDIFFLFKMMTDLKV